MPPKIPRARSSLSVYLVLIIPTIVVLGIVVAILL